MVSNHFIFQAAPVFQDRAVLQRGVMVPVWGRGRPGVQVRATCAGLSACTTTSDSGHWLLRLPPLPVGGPYLLVLEDGEGGRIEFRDVLVGDVWICSGQSNMEYMLSQVDLDGSQSRGAYHPHLRLLTVATAAGAEGQTGVAGVWQEASPESLAAFSAVGSWFGRTLHGELGVPIGLIANAWGGTRIQAWLSREALMSDPETRKEIEPYERVLYGIDARDEKKHADADEWFRAEGPEDPGAHGQNAGWHLGGFDDATWPVMTLPTRWQDQGHAFNGIMWFRRRVNLPPEWQGRDLVLELGAIDKHDETFVNGRLAGAMGWENRNSWCTPRRYLVPEAWVRGGEVVIAVRVRSHLYHGGMTGPARLMRLSLAHGTEAAICLAGPWRFGIEQNWGVVQPPALTSDGRGPGGPNAPYVLFQSRIHPVLPYGIRGWIWYQGESNVGEAALYRRLLPLLVADWRRAWGQGELPFMVVQLAGFQPAREEPGESTWAELRAAQATVLRLPHTGLATAVDVGDPMDIHPRDKKSVGLRLARWALSRVYGRGGLPGGPLLRRCTVEADGRLRLGFDFARGLRTVDGGPVRHLAIAGADGRFFWAQAVIEGEELVVWSPEVPQPIAVRYAWADNPVGANLVNEEGLPAYPFDSRDPA